MKNNDAETVLKLTARILLTPKLQGPACQNKVGIYLNIDKRKVGKYIESLAKRRFIQSSEHEASIVYRITSTGTRFAENLEALMKGDEF
jgi:predicted transcriptional regulator